MKTCINHTNYDASGKGQFCTKCTDCRNCYSCKNSTNCFGCHKCYYCKNITIAQHNYFCWNESREEIIGLNYLRRGRHYRIFNVEVTEEEYNSVTKIFSLLNKKKWKRMSDKAKQKIYNIPHFNREGFTFITGIAEPVDGK